MIRGDAVSSAMSRDHHDARAQRVVDALDAHGMIVCNPRDREAAHRADVGAIATTDDPAAVTCPRCRARLTDR